MREILIEMEHLLFSDSKVKILAIDATGNPELDKSKLEGINVIIKKYIREILLHFNLPFEKDSLEPQPQGDCPGSRRNIRGNHRYSVE